MFPPKITSSEARGYEEDPDQQMASEARGWKEDPGQQIASSEARS